MSGDVLPLRSRAAREEIAQSLGKLGHVLLIQLGSPLRRPRASALTCISVGEALTLSLRERGLLNQNALALVASSCTAEADHDRIERRVLPGAARERSIPAGQKHQVVEVGAGHAERPLLLDRKSTRLNSSHLGISYAVFCLKKKSKTTFHISRTRRPCRQGLV